MNRHPGGDDQIISMLEKAKEIDAASRALQPGASALDLGAGDGDTVYLLRQLGYDAAGLDLDPRGQNVSYGNFLSLDVPTESVDLCVSQCSFFVSGDASRALNETYRVLKPGGWLFLADLDPGNLERLAVDAGYHVHSTVDMTRQWKEYYLQAVWSGSFCCEEYRQLAKDMRGKRTGYSALILQKP